MLTSRGSIAFSVWDVPPADTGMRIVIDAIAEHGAPVRHVLALRRCPHRRDARAVRLWYAVLSALDY